MPERDPRVFKLLKELVRCEHSPLHVETRELDSGDSVEHCMRCGAVASLGIHGRRWRRTEIAQLLVHATLDEWIEYVQKPA